MFQNLQYFDGFNGHVSSEAIAGALPIGQNSPQICPLGLYAEQLSGSAFTCPRYKNLRSWLYRIRPSVVHKKFTFYSNKLDYADKDLIVDPNQMRFVLPILYLYI